MWEEVKNLPPEQQKRKLCEEVEEVLILSCIDGMNRVIDSFPLREDFDDEIEDFLLIEHPFTEKEIREAGEVDIPSIVNTPTKGETFRERIERRIDEQTLSPETLKVIVETESHRCEENSAFQSAKQIQSFTNLSPFKVWRTMEDDKVRFTHDYIDHDIVGIDEYFETYDGDKARCPGDFEDPNNNINCRCWLDYIWI